MATIKNPNAPCKQRLRARAGKARKGGSKASKVTRWERAGISNADATRGARPGLMPTSGPGRPLSKKKQRKVEHRLAMALKRQLEAEGEVEVKGGSRYGLHIFFGGVGG